MGPFFTLRDLAFLKGPSQTYDNFEGYTDLALLDGLNGGAGAWGGPYVARSNLTGIQTFDNIEMYTDGASLDALDNGGWGGAYSDRTNSIIASTLAAQWKASSFSLSDGTAIGGTGNEWLDQTSNHNDATQSTSGSRPLFKTNIFGSAPSIRFDGTDDFLVFPAISLSGDWTIIAVTKNVSVDGMVMGHSTINNQVRIFQSGGNVLSLYDGTNNPVTSTLATSASNARMNVWRRGRIDISNAAGFYENNGTDFSTGLNLGMTLQWIGKYTGAVFPFNGDIGELRVYTASLTVGQIQDLYTSYFKPTYGLP